MHDCRPSACEAGKAGADQVFAALGEDLQQDILWHAIRLGKPADEIELCLASAWKANLNLFDTDFEEQVEEAVLLMSVHRVDDRLIAIAQIGREPAWRGRYAARGPLPVGQINLWEAFIFSGGIV